MSASIASRDAAAETLATSEADLPEALEAHEAAAAALAAAHDALARKKGKGEVHMTRDSTSLPTVVVLLLCHCSAAMLLLHCHSPAAAASNCRLCCSSTSPAGRCRNRGGRPPRGGKAEARASHRSGRQDGARGGERERDSLASRARGLGVPSPIEPRTLAACHYHRTEDRGCMPSPFEPRGVAACHRPSNRRPWLHVAVHHLRTFHRVSK